ncbi:MAG: prepilin-type N-terminal cleavage/methylation domain-containing protein [Planctomycetes bacterium]|nr:prepilin-type N-terminal cleavage/methylation domain-containing protein [Planctomycetota bacterium]
MKRKGFSLIELLVVISIVSLLMGMLLPSLNRARQQAKSIFCLNNLRQMAIAANSYACSYDDHYPLAYYTKRINGIRYYYSWDFTTWKDWSTTPATEVVEPGLLWQGDTIEKVHQCPSFKGTHNWLADPYTGYNYNTSYIGMNETVSPPNSARTTEVGRPSETAIFGDGQYSGGANKFMRAPFSNPRDASFSDPARAAGTQGYRHLSKTNVAFCDGHAESIRKIFTNTDSIGQDQLDRYNETHDIRIGFLSKDNGLYDLKLRLIILIMLEPVQSN